MSIVLKVENKQTSTGKPMKNVTLDEPVLGKKYFNVFNFHTRYAEVTEGRAFAPEEFRMNGQYLELIDPNKAIKGYKAPSTASPDKLDQILKELAEIKQLIKDIPPF